MAPPPTRDAAQPELTDDEIDRLRRFGTERAVAAGATLFESGDPSYDFIVILEGKVRILGGPCDDPVVVATHGPRKFLGELSMLTGQRPVYTAEVTEPGRILVVARAELRSVFAAEPDLADVILRSFVARRRVLLDGEGSRSI